VINAKPAPDIYLYTARQLGIEPKHCLAIEDSVNGVRAAHAAGITTIMVAECKPAVEVQIEKITHRYFPTLHELRSYLDG
jgi:beta-phosphoglucomutase-like phosphatase (HAD superfamily)